MSLFFCSINVKTVQCNLAPSPERLERRCLDLDAAVALLPAALVRTCCKIEFNWEIAHEHLSAVPIARKNRLGWAIDSLGGRYDKANEP